jgi:Ca2+-binding RTX toxin-like protein
MATFQGDDGPNTIIGTVLADMIYGAGGDDLLIGGDGDDVIDGGDGRDTLIGGRGNDYLDGGGGGPSTVDYGAEGGPRGIAVNLLRTGAVGDLFADSAIDSFGYFDRVPNVRNVIGTRFDDIIYGGGRDNTLSGRAGNDELLGGRGDDIIDGGSGIDTAIYSGTRADYAISAGPNGSITVRDLRAGTPDDTDTVTRVELLVFADGLYSSKNGFTAPVAVAQTAPLYGGYWGGGGNDYQVGDFGANMMVGGGGTDFMFGGDGSDALYGGEGDDHLFGQDGDDVMTGDGGNDLLDGGTGKDTLNAGGGNNRINAGSGDDLATAGAGNDTVVLGGGNDVFYDAGGANKYQLGGIESLASDGNDQFWTGGGSDKFALYFTDAAGAAAGFGSDTINGFRIAQGDQLVAFDETAGFWDNPAQLAALTGNGSITANRSADGGDLVLHFNGAAPSSLTLKWFFWDNQAYLSPSEAQTGFGQALSSANTTGILADVIQDGASVGVFGPDVVAKSFAYIQDDFLL